MLVGSPAVEHDPVFGCCNPGMCSEKKSKNPEVFYERKECWPSYVLGVWAIFIVPCLVAAVADVVVALVMNPKSYRKIVRFAFFKTLSKFQSKSLFD